MQAGVRELRNHLSRYIRHAEAGETIEVTSHGRVVAELVPPAQTRSRHGSRYGELVLTGAITPAVESGDPLQDLPDVRLPTGTAAALIDEDRAED